MTQPAAPDPAELARIFGEVASHSSRILGDFLKRQAEHKEAAPTDEFGIARAYMDLAAKMFANPYQLAAAQINMFRDYMSLWQFSMARLTGTAPEPVAAPVKGDNRFRDEDWQNHFLFDYIKQSYLITARHVQDAVAQTEGLSDASRKKVNFFTRQYLDAMAPSNFALTNPQVLRETAHSGGQNLLRGLNNLLGDIERGDGELRISMTDPKAFTIGVNVATTPGKVVFQTDLMQLIQYEPTTTEVLKCPLLMEHFPYRESRKVPIECRFLGSRKTITWMTCGKAAAASLTLESLSAIERRIYFRSASVEAAAGLTARSSPRTAGRLL